MRGLRCHPPMAEGGAGGRAAEGIPPPPRAGLIASKALPPSTGVPPPRSSGQAQPRHSIWLPAAGDAPLPSPGGWQGLRNAPFPSVWNPATARVRLCQGPFSGKCSSCLLPAQGEPCAPREPVAFLAMTTKPLLEWGPGSHGSESELAHQVLRPGPLRGSAVPTFMERTGDAWLSPQGRVRAPGPQFLPRQPLAQLMVPLGDTAGEVDTDGGPCSLPLMSPLRREEFRES